MAAGPSGSRPRAPVERHAERVITDTARLKGAPGGAPAGVASTLKDERLTAGAPVAAASIAPVPGPLRVFISSTMRDLANERDAVARRLRAFNFEPVNAEGLLPDGTNSWDRLEPEILSADVFLLLLGSSYGWVPDSGPKAGEGKSVTELEFDVAREAGIPVLVFMQRLPHGVKTDEHRDDFRDRVGAWDGGLFRAEFDLASDLAEKVGRALVELVTEGFRRADRRPAPAPSFERTVALPDALIDAVADRSAVLLLGAGASLQAGMPSAAAFVEAMIERIQEIDPGYQRRLSGTAFNAVASDFESLLGSDRLRELARQMVDPPSLGQPTEAHHAAGRLFDVVITTNYDVLLERAVQGRDTAVLAGEGELAARPGALQLIKLHGTISEPDGMVMTEGELARLEETRPHLWAGLQALLRRRPLLSIGSSLRDPSVLRLLESCRPDLRGWAVLYDVSEVERRRLARWGLTAVPGDANSVLAALEEEVRVRRRDSPWVFPNRCAPAPEDPRADALSKCDDADL